MKIGVIGAGHLGKIHIKILKDTPGLNLVGFYDTNLKVANEVGNKFSVKSFSSLNELMNDVDIVDVVTPTSSHFEYAKKALLLNKHVFIEKPVTDSYEQAQELIYIASSRDLKVQVGHVERFNPAFLAAQAHIGLPLFIETHRLSNFNPRGTDVSVVLDLMIHDIDVILHIVKSKVTHINASGVSVVTDNPDICNARIEFKNGCVANLTSSRISLKEMRKTRIFQKDRYISIDFLNKKTEIVALSKEQSWNPLKIKLPIDIGGTKKFLSFKKPRVKKLNSIKEELRNFALSIKNNKPPLVTLKEGSEAIRIAQLIIDQVTNKIEENIIND